jgi:hypothetical protein
VAQRHVAARRIPLAGPSLAQGLLYQSELGAEIRCNARARRTPMSTTTTHSTEQDSRDEPSGDVFATRIFVVGIAGLCVVILMMIVGANW